LTSNFISGIHFGAAHFFTIIQRIKMKLGVDPFAARIRKAHKRRFKKEPTEIHVYTHQSEVPDPNYFKADSLDHEANTRTQWIATAQRVRHFSTSTLSGPIQKTPLEIQAAIDAGILDEFIDNPRRQAQKGGGMICPPRSARTGGSAMRKKCVGLADTTAELVGAFREVPIVRRSPVFGSYPFAYFLGTDGERPEVVAWLSGLIAGGAWRGDVHLLYVDNLVFMASSDRRDIEDVAEILGTFKRRGINLTANAA
jgi:hypothetical protein